MPLTGEAAAANDHDLELGTAKSGTSGSSESNARVRAERYFETWRDTIMDHDLSVLRALQWRIVFSVLLIVLFSTLGFFLIDRLLFGSVAETVINLDRKARDFRPDIVDSVYTARSMFLSAAQGQRAPSDALREYLSEISTSVAQQHLDNYQHSPAGLGGYYQDPRWNLYEPIGRLKLHGHPNVC